MSLKKVNCVPIKLYNQSKKQVWLVWSLSQDGLIQLRSIDTKEWIAATHLRMIQHGIDEGSSAERSIRAWIEVGETNHMFAAGMYGKR
jgi:hypothetical protein